MKQLKALIFGSLFFLGAADSASAALTLSLTPSMMVLPASGGTVSFTGSVTGDAGENLLGYDIFFDVSNIELSGSPGQAITISNQQPLAFGGSFFDPSVGSEGRDIGFSNTGLFLALSTDGGLDLFTFDATFAPVDIETTYLFELATTAPGFQIASDTDGNVDAGSISFNGASVTVAAVPEPSNLAVLGGILFLGACRLRRSRAAV